MEKEKMPEIHFSYDSKNLRKDNKIDRDHITMNLLEFAISNNLPVRQIFKEFAQQHYLDSQNLSANELRELAYGLSSYGKLAYGMQLIVHALDITPENAKTVIPEMFPDFKPSDMQAMGAIWEMEDLLGWPRGTTYPQVKRWGI